MDQIQHTNPSKPEKSASDVDLNEVDDRQAMIHNIDHYATVSEVLQELTIFGKIDHLRIFQHCFKKTNRKYGYVLYSSSDNMLTACKADIWIKGKQLAVIAKIEIPSQESFLEVNNGVLSPKPDLQTLAEEQKKAVEMRNVDDQQQTEGSCKKTPKITEKPTVSVEKPPKKLNQSIEEGELVSDDESSPKKDIENDKKKPYQVGFDVKTYDQETFSIIHDESKKNTRKITDYNFDILTKKIAANVYIAEIDSEVEKMLSFSPFQFLLDIPSKLSTLASQESTSSQIQIKKRPNPLKISYNQLIKSSEDRQQSSPLDDLYAPESSTRENRKSNEESNKRSSERRLSMEKIDNSDKLEKSKSKSKSLINENTSTKEPCPSKDEPKITDGISDQEKVNNEVTTTENLKETESSKSSSLHKKKNTTESTSGLEVVDGVIMLNSNAENTLHGQSDDELMNDAIIGSKRVEDDESLVTYKKHKTTEEADEGKSQEKKQKTEVWQELLQNIDIDSFLKKVHGET